jgi:hypothetical protein
LSGLDGPQLLFKLLDKFKEFVSVILILLKSSILTILYFVSLVVLIPMTIWKEIFHRILKRREKKIGKIKKSPSLQSASWLCCWKNLASL